jgi:hypothetical protein
VAAADFLKDRAELKQALVRCKMGFCTSYVGS